MATAGICSTFSYVIEGADLNVAKTFTATRDFTIIGIQSNNTAAGAGTLTVEKIVTVGGVPTTTTITATTAAPPIAGAAVVQAQSVAGPVSDAALIAANAAVPADATVRVTASATTITKVVLLCVGTAQSVTIA